MKHLSTLILAASLLTGSLTSYAVIQGDGYYRVRNKSSERYVYVTDDKGSFNISTTFFDLGAIVLSKDTQRCISDPGCIIYVKSINGTYYDFLSQGTGVSKLFDRYPQIMEWPPRKTTGEYRIYGTDGSLAKYLSDGTKATWKVEGTMTEHDSNMGDWHLWYFDPVDATTDQYFGVKPTVEIDGEYYAPFYAEFPFSFASEGMKAYYVTTTGKSANVLEEVPDGHVPAATPVIIKCAGPDPADNKLNIGGEYAKLTGNRLSGVYFSSSKDGHINRREYKPATMRVLGVTADGRLGMVTPDNLDYLPSNTAYLTVDPTEVADVPFVSQAEWDAMAGIANVDAAEIVVRVNGRTITVDGATLPVEVYNVMGVKVISTSAGSFSLPASGVYVLRCGAFVKKLRVI